MKNKNDVLNNTILISSTNQWQKGEDRSNYSMDYVCYLAKVPRQTKYSWKHGKHEARGKSAFRVEAVLDKLNAVGEIVISYQYKIIPPFIKMHFLSCFVLFCPVLSCVYF